ncbi:radical SAM family heme chaperone HemW [Eubacterium ventriosum]|uniref:radical SAM family heme chaperone HemW n=1 Tax=Eubacterium ventriosum TaxID=39496 RepID=UPI001C010579|nr:radical SAM family heme chaperone HemW [Eubacterium ventriosum]MBT9697825.1 radical SAM family heme chaperone HemW [Eubacterium ventriosum]
MNGLEIYIHIPFCVKKCDYCDFLSAPADLETKEKYVEALINEIKLNKNKMSEYVVDTVFIGGGTPSLLEENQISKIMSVLRDNCNMSENPEITIECNPGTITESKLLEYKKSGINRISFGLQSANDEELKSIGRIHNYAGFLESYNLARKCGFDNINVDLMSALPGQTLKSYEETLNKVVRLEPEHISAYSLIVEENTLMYDRVKKAQIKGINILPDEESERKMYYLTNNILRSNGYRKYEISNYSKPGKECKHNIGYWQRKEYLGFGIGAASLYKENRYNNISDINKYIEVLTNNIKENSINNVGNSSEVENQVNILNSIVKNLQQLTERDRMEEFMFLGLRMMEGVSMEKFEQYFGKPYMEVYGKVQKRMEDKRFLINDNGYVKLTEFGIDLSNYVMSEFLF